MCYPPDESNDILQMKTIFKKINRRNKLGVSTHSHYDYKSVNYNCNNYQKPQCSREDYKIPHHQGRQILFVRFLLEMPLMTYTLGIKSLAIVMNLILKSDLI